MLNLAIKFSRLEFAFATLCHVLALFALTLIDLPVTALGLMVLPITTSLIQQCYQALPGSDSRVRSLLLRSEDCVLRYAGEELCASLPGIKYYSEFVLVLEFRVIDSTHVIRLNLLPDSLSPEDDRRLRRYLRFADCP
ncbi:MAG: hypothetical protein O2971_07015 [Proteobacteria bacterium]|nr:hypothetical protein [Pseudomonadota bacterium]